MGARILGFAFGFAAGMMALSLWLWASGRLPERSGEPNIVVGETLKPPEGSPTAPVLSSASQPLDPPPAQAMRLPPAPEQPAPLPAPPRVDVQSPETASADRVVEGPSGIAAPIAGLKAAVIHDTYDETRGTDRVHEALDIMAPRGTPVLAAVEGNVVKIFESKQGGHTVYQFDNRGEYCYYYAHLDRYAPGLREGMLLRQGDVLGYVGSTGNASPDAPHLHFAIFRLGSDKKWWEGQPVNPYPLVLEAIQ
jgi:murein DD-endopeptidase MepM/ murein hydrolase activator NlpD